VDFLRVDPTHKVKVKVPVKLLGIPYGVKTQGGMLDFVHRHLEIECLPSLIPAHVDVNVEALKVGDSVRFDQLGLASTLRILGDAHEVVAAVHGKAAEEEIAPAAVAEPEVVAAKGKKDKK
jgi:large subunit ribosomal protein L25